MKAALLYEFNAPLFIENIAEPHCPIDGVIIDVKACGICRSDHHAWTGVDPDVRLPHIMGHEFSGIIVETGTAVKQFKRGDRVTAPFILGCGLCPSCHAGQATICDHQAVIGFTQWGAFAERVSVRAADFNLVHLPETVNFQEAAAMGCRVTTAWRALTERAQLQAGEWVAIHGCGGVGLSAVMLAKALDAQVIAIDVSDDALALASKLGADLTLNALHSTHLGEHIQHLTGGGTHVSIDAVGSQVTFNNALRSLKKLGRHVQIGMPVAEHAHVMLPLLELVYARQLSILGTRGMSASGFPSLLDIVATGKLPLREMITQLIPLEEAGLALHNLDQQALAGITMIDQF